MSLFPILPLQVRATTPDASVPDSGGSPPDSGVSPPASRDASSSPDGGTASAPDASGQASPSTPDAGPPPPDARAPQAPAAPSTPPSPGSGPNALTMETQSFYLSPMFGYGWRGFGNHSQDLHEGIQLGFTVGYPTLRISPSLYLRPEFLYRHEWMGRNIPAEFGMGIQSSADLDTLGLGAVFGFLPHPLFGIEAGFNLGLTHLGANAPMDGRGGIRYADNRFGYSADNWGFNVEARLRLGVPEQRIADGFYLGGGAEASFGYNAFSLTPDSLSRSPSDPAIGVDSIHGGIGFYLTGRFGSVPPPPPTPPSSSSPQREPEHPTPPAAPPVAPTPPPAPSPSVSRLGRVNFTVRPGTDGSMAAVRDPQGFSAFFTQRILSADAVHTAVGQAGTEPFRLNLRVRYNNQSQGSLEVVDIQIGETTYANGHFPPDMRISTSTIQAIVQAIADTGLPTYTGNRSRPLDMEVRSPQEAPSSA